MLWRRRVAQAQASRQAEGRQEAHAPVRQGGNPAGGVHRRAEGGCVVVTDMVIPLANRPYFSYRFSESRSRKGRPPVTPAGGARAVPAGGGSSPPLPGGSGDIRPAGTMTGLRGNPLDWDRKERVTPAEKSARSFEPSGSCAPTGSQEARSWSWAAAFVRCGKRRGG